MMKNPITDVNSFADMATKRTGTIGGFVESVTPKKTRTGRDFVEIMLNDGNESRRIRIWPWFLGDGFDVNSIDDGSVLIVDVIDEDKWGMSNIRNGQLRLIQ